MRTLPDDILDADIAILGRKGGGKTYTAKGIVERLLDLKRRVLILDPLGVWAGLRTLADGETAGYPVAIFGGEHGDEPLNPALAEPLAQIIANENLPVVIDLSELSKTAQGTFLYRFLHELRRVNREALTIVLEEADVFAPQNPQGDDSKLLHSEIDWIARRGRFRGFRLMTVTQRPARLSKDVLTQANCLIMHRLPAPQDRDAAKAWVDGNGDRDKAKTVFDTLAGLKVGQAWVLAQEPEMLERMSFPPIKTLDTSATPKAGESRVEPKTLAQVDLSGIRKALREAEQAEQTKAAEKKIVRGSGGGELISRVIYEPNDEAIADAEQRGFKQGFNAGVAAARQDFFHEFEARMMGVIAELRRDDPVATETIEIGKEILRRAPIIETPEGNAGRKIADEIEGHGAALKLLDAFGRYDHGITWVEACIVAGMISGNGYFYRGKKQLVQGEYVIELGDHVTITEKGRQKLGRKGRPMTLAEIVSQWTAKIGAPGGPMLQHLAKRPRATLGTDELAQAIGAKPGNGYWYRGVKSIRNAGLIEQTSGSFRLSEFLRAAA